MQHPTSQKAVALATLAYLAFVIYGSWVPLNFSPLSLADALQRFLDLPFGEQAIESATDWATNGILLVPFTFLLGQGIKRWLPGAGAFASVMLAAIAGLLLAVFLEFSQIYFPPRTVSQKDILALSLGGIIGAVAQLRWGAVVEGWLEMLWRQEQGRSGLIRVLHAYLLVVLLFSILPLDLTVSVVEIYHKWAEGRLVLTPFGGSKGGIAEITYEFLSDLLLWLPVGLLLAMERRTTILGTATLVGLLAFGIEVAQLFVYSRVTDITDPLVAAMGGGLGGFLARRENRLKTLIGGLASHFWYRAWMAWAVIMLAVFWFPFDFSVTPDLPERAQGMWTRLPFLSLYQSTEFRAINEILHKIALFVPGGLLWGMASASSKNNATPQMRAGLLLMLILASLIEAGQLLLPGKFTDTTDILLCACGGWLGLRLTRFLLSKNWRLQKDTVQQTGARQAPATLANMAINSTAFSIKHTQIIAFAAIGISLLLIVRLPGVPYNIKELVAPGLAGFGSIACVAFALQWMINGHFLWLRSEQSARRLLLLLPFWLMGHALVSWFVLRLGVPLESIHDIVGSPVLDWAWEFEMIGRFIALHSAYNLALIGAILLAAGISGKKSKKLLGIWFIWCQPIAWILQTVIVTNAATDNLTELMREGGHFPYAALLFLGIFLASLAATLLASLATQANYRILKGALMALAATASIACLWFGSEPMIIKYGKVFSAWQFLLSPDRNHYISGPQLWLHFALAFSGYIGLVATLQYPFWKNMAPLKRQHRAGHHDHSRISEAQLSLPTARESQPRKTHHDPKPD